MKNGKNYRANWKNMNYKPKSECEKLCKIINSCKFSHLKPI